MNIDRQHQGIIDALVERIKNIKEDRNFPLTVKKVTAVPSLSTSYNNYDLPAVEIIEGDTKYETKTGGNTSCYTDVIIRIVAKKTWTDSDMAVFRSSIFRSLYADSYKDKTNSMATLVINGQHSLLKPVPVQCVTDLNMLDKHRIWNLLFCFEYIAHTYNM